MANYIITGELGAGKSLVAVGKIRDHLQAGLRVATNLNIFPEKMLPSWHKRGELIRIPDFPTRDDLEAIGQGGPSPEEKTFGLLVLDECADYLNSREYGDKNRSGLLHWFRHARKLRWSVMFLVQDLEAIDKQLRKALGEYIGQCRRWDRMALVGYALPRLHVCYIRYGRSARSPISAKWRYRGNDLFAAYDTEQVFVEREAEGAVQENTRIPMPGVLTGVRPPKSKLARFFAKPGDPVNPVQPPLPMAQHWPPVVGVLTPEERFRAVRRAIERGLDPVKLRPLHLIKLAG